MKYSIIIFAGIIFYCSSAYPMEGQDKVGVKEIGKAFLAKLQKAHEDWEARKKKGETYNQHVDSDEVRKIQEYKGKLK